LKGLNMQKRKTTLYLTIMVMLVLQACNLPSSAVTEEPTVDPLIAVGQTLTAIAELNPPTDVPPTFTPLPTFSPTAEFTATPNFTATPTFAYVTLSEGTNCRVGPGIVYALIDTFLIGQTIEVVGKHPFDNYWYVRSPNNPSVYCWLWGFYATGANLNNVPVLTPPPSPTPAPDLSFTADYVNYGKCIAWWTRIKLTNTGPIAFKSVSVTIKDTVTNETQNASKDGFQDVNACALAVADPTLGPGGTQTIVAPSLTADPSGHKINATITLCTEVGQGGSCTSKSIEFTP